MKSSRSKVLVVATVTGIQDTYVTYPYCTECYGKLNTNCHLNQWSCFQCQISYESDCVPYRYCVRLNVADETSSCNVSAFGKTLRPYFGLPAIEMQKILDLQHSKKEIMEALKKTFVGKCFIFEFKTSFLDKSSHLCLLSVVKANDNSSFGSNLIAYRIISNHCTNNDNVHNYLMQNKQLSYSKKLKMSKSHSLPDAEILNSGYSVSCSILFNDSILYESIVLSWEIKKSECQNLKKSLTAFHSDKSSSSFLLNTSKVTELNFDENVYKEPSRTHFPPSKNLQIVFAETLENMKPHSNNKSERQEIYQHFENISISEMSQDETGNIVDLEEDISAKLNQNWKSLSETIESEDVSIFNYFDERICECSSKMIEICKQDSLKKSQIIPCSANNSLEDVNNFLKKISALIDPNYSSTAVNLSGDLFATMSEENSSFSEKCNVSNPCEIFLSSTPCLENKKEITSFYTTPTKSFLLFNHSPNKVFCQLFDNSTDFQFSFSARSHLERKLSVSLMISGPELQRKEKQINNQTTVFSQSKRNRQAAIFKENHSYRCPKSQKSKKRVKKFISKTNFTCLSLKSCTSPDSSFNRLSSKLSHISKPKTNNYQKTFTSTPISDSSKNCSPQLYDAFGTPMKKTDIQEEDICCDSPSLLQNESLHCHGSLKKVSLEQNKLSFDLFASSDDSHESLSLHVSAKNNNECSQDLFSSESNESSLSSISINDYMTPVSLKSTGQYLTRSEKKKLFAKKNNLKKKGRQ